jgi:oligosaccharide repeat unit polymerase
MDQVSVSAWAGLAILVGVALAARMRFGNWRHPAAFFGALWGCASFPAYLVGLGRISGLAMVVCGALVGAFFMGSLAASLGDREATSTAEPWGLDSRKLTGWVTLLGLLGMVAVASYVAGSSAGLSSLSNLEGWMNMAVSYSVARYQGEDTESASVRLLVSLNYSGTVLAGALSAFPNARRRLVVYLPIVACALMTIITTAKTPLLLGVLCMASGRFATQMARGSVGPGGVAGGRVRAVLLLAVASFVSLVSLVFRYGGSSGADLQLIVQRLGGYLFGQVYAFSAWVTTGGLNVSDVGLGRYSLAGAFELVGIGRRESGFYDYIALDDASAESNIFTAFRGLIQDLSLPGALVFLFTLGALVHLVGRPMRSVLSQVLGITMVSATYLFLGWSPFISVFNYNGVLLAIVAVFLALMFSVKGGVPAAESAPAARSGLGQPT